jgi:hypothetical protein
MIGAAMICNLPKLIPRLLRPTSDGPVHIVLNSSQIVNMTGDGFLGLVPSQSYLGSDLPFCKPTWVAKVPPILLPGCSAYCHRLYGLEDDHTLQYYCEYSSLLEPLNPSMIKVCACIHDSLL